MQIAVLKTMVHAQWHFTFYMLIYLFNIYYSYIHHKYMNLSRWYWYWWGSDWSIFRLFILFGGFSRESFLKILLLRIIIKYARIITSPFYYLHQHTSTSIHGRSSSPVNTQFQHHHTTFIFLSAKIYTSHLPKGLRVQYYAV